MTQTRHATSADPAAAHGSPDPPPRRARWFVGAVALLVLLAVVIATFLVLSDDEVEGQTADVNAQGDADATLATDAARLVRRADGLVAEIAIDTPEPGSYAYPTGDMIPPWAESHPAVSPGASGAPEVFTMWLFAFNDPGRCTDGVCDLDDLGPEAAARGGSYQVDGRVADGDTLTLAGSVRLGQRASSGAPLDNPIGAEVHVAIAPHGRALSGPDGWRQLNGPVGNPSLWWAASFLP